MQPAHASECGLIPAYAGKTQEQRAPEPQT